MNRAGADVYLTEFRAEKSDDAEKIAELKQLGINVETGGHSDEFIKMLI
ncbi:MAG: hypothetical protein ACLSA2_09285 [Candidatus Gastranaerophilaceae bacterium]